MALYSYAVTLFVSAFLLFLVQPIVGQKILPKLGGTPSVWNTCVVFFQCALLVGYAYTHFTSKLPVKKQILIHCLLLFLPFLILLPYGPFPIDKFEPSWFATGDNPTIPTLIILATIVGIPFFVVSTTAPLLQKWFGATGHPAAKDPYFLYGASNLGSMLSLLLYPPVFEPVFGLAGQSWFYTYGYVVLVCLVMACAWLAYAAAPTVQLPSKKAADGVEKTPSMIPEPPAEPIPSAAQTTVPAPTTAVASGPPPASVAPRPAIATGIKKGGKKLKGRDLAKAGPAVALGESAAVTTVAPSIAKVGVRDPDAITWTRRLRWIGLAAVPSSLMLGVTVYMSTDISAIPLFWVLPLALYLLSFILVFMRWPINWLEQAHEFILYAQPITLALLALLMVVLAGASFVQYMILVMLLAFTITALACHGELAKDRPSSKHLTEFYLLMSVGGAVGGLFNGIIAPLIFPWGIIEFPLVLMIAGILRPTMSETGWTETFFENMGSESAAPGGKGGKGGKKIAKAPGDHSGLALTFDILLPVGVMVLLVGALFLLVDKHKPDEYTEKLFFACIVPVICTACFYARPLRFGLALGAVLLVTGLYTHEGADILTTTRSYFGLLRVRQGGQYYGKQIINYVNLMHGTTHHGMNFRPGENVPDFSRLATTYYHRQGPVGICMERFNWFPKDYDNNSFWADNRMPASLVGLGAPSLGINLPMAQLVGTWTEPAYAVIGLGTGTMASYARPYHTVHFYEIDHQIRKFSLPDPGEEGYFTYLSGALDKRKANLHVFMGDARLRMAIPWETRDNLTDKPWENKGGGPEYFYHLMVVDAFSSDAIPRHLITKEAMEMYFRHLVQGHWVDVPEDQRDAKNPESNKVWAPGGVLCVHTSNRHLRLVPVVADTANVVAWDDQYDRDSDGKPKKRTGLAATRGHDIAPGAQYLKTKEAYKNDIGHFTSEWVIVARDQKDLKHLFVPSRYNEWCKAAQDEHPRQRIADEPYWTPLEATGRYIWTDDHSNLMAVFQWHW